jgi:hypothetical protein
MIRQIDSIRKTRTWALELTRGLSSEQLNLVLPGFNNNMIWNLGHMVAAQQGVCYVRMGLPPVIDEDLFNAYKPGSRPMNFAGPEEIELIKTLLFSTLDELEKDVQLNLFSGYKPWTTRYGIELHRIEEAVSFLLYHEGLHAGVITSMKKIVVG